ncbi:MAG: thiamine-phosphate kinase [Thermoplasmata archaeon]|nr:thiamine-phosphate kinase [Thermoplasmata archaeon]
MPRSRARRDAPLEEREFHSWLSRHLTGPSRGLLPVGDDAAALRVPRGRVAVLSTDSLVEGTHFLIESPAASVGAAAANVSLSDVAAKGAQPAALLLDLIVPVGTPRRWAEDLVRAADRAGASVGAPLVGGDTKPGPTRTVVSTVLGWGRPDRLVARGGARPGDVLVTTGTVGRGGLAAHRLGRTRSGRTSARKKALVGILDIRPRVREGLVLAEFAHAMLDTSDGLADASWLLAGASGCRTVVEEGLLPLALGLRASASSPGHRRSLAFYGGDYELLAALPAGTVARARAAVRRTGGRLTVIGGVERGRGAVLRNSGRSVRMPLGGWRPFSVPSPPIP